MPLQGVKCWNELITLHRGCPDYSAFLSQSHIGAGINTEPSEEVIKIWRGAEVRAISIIQFVDRGSLVLRRKPKHTVVRCVCTCAGCLL